MPAKRTNNARSVDHLVKIVVALIGAAALVIVGWWQFGPRPNVGTTLRLNGRVIDATTQLPVHNARISLEGKGVPPILYTDTEGVFAFELPKTLKNARLRVYAAGYDPLDRRLDLLSDGQLEDIRIAPTVPRARTEDPPSAVPAPPAVAWQRTITEDTFLSQSLEVPGHTFQSLRYRNFVSHQGTRFSHGLVVASADRSSSMISYNIPNGAKRFVAVVAPYDETCTRGDINGWTTIIETAMQSVTKDAYPTSDDQRVELRVDDIPAGRPRVLNITVKPNAGNRTCDHSGLGDPHFEP